MFASIGRSFKERFGVPGIIATLALCLAVGGTGAWAAKGGFKITKLSQIKPSVQKQLKGQVGPQGPVGPSGSGGAKGDAGGQGPQGPQGPQGADGRTVLNGTATPSAATGALGDFYIETDVDKIYGPKASSGANGGWGSGTDLVGPEGSPWTAGGTLPEDATETGVYGPVEPGVVAAAVEKGTSYQLPVSFAIPLETAPEFVFVPTNAGASFGTAAGCPGVTGGIPSAESGKFCVYAAPSSLFDPPLPDSTVEASDPAAPGLPGVSPAGAILGVSCTEDGNPPAFCWGSGVWAVTG